MKKYLILLLISFLGVIHACGQIAPSSQPLRWPVTMVYNGDTLKMFFTGDTTKFYTDKGLFVFTKPLMVNKDRLAFQKDIDTLFAQLARKQDNIVESSPAYYYAGNKTWVLFPSSMPASDVYAWAKEPEKPTYTASEVGLDQVDNTSDANKPISTATQAALDLKAPINNPTFTGTVGGITKSMVGLGNVDNTSDANKPVSNATQDSLDDKQDVIPLSTALYYYRGDKTWQLLDKSAVGLGNVDNTSDINKPVSNAQLDSINQRLRINATAANSNLLQGIDTTWIKENGGGNATLPANTTGQDVVVGRSASDGWIYFKIDSLFTGTGTGGGTSLNGLGFVKANGTTITYDNTTYEPLISAGGNNTNQYYYSGTKTFQPVPIGIAGSGLTRTGSFPNYTYSLGSTTSDDIYIYPSVHGTKYLNFGIGGNAFQTISFQTGTSGGQYANVLLNQNTLTLDASQHNSIIFGRSAVYNGDYSSVQTDPNSIPSLNRVRQIVHDSVASIFPANPTGSDVLFGLDEYNNKIYFEIDSLETGTTLNGTGYVRMVGTTPVYDNRTLQSQLNGTGYVVMNGTTVSYQNSTFEPVLPTGYSSSHYLGGDKQFRLLSKDVVGLDQVNNTSDVNKPISTATQSALNGKQATLVSGTNIKTINGSSILGSGDLTISSGSSHDPVTLGTANGLYLSGQVLSLSTASSIGSGALSSTDWNTFNNKVSFPGFGTSNSTAARGDHLHTGVYQPAGSYQSQLSGTGFVKASGTTISYDNTSYQPLSGAWNTTNLNLASVDFSARTLTLGRNGTTANIKGDVSNGNIIMDAYSTQGVFLQNYVSGNVYLTNGGGKVAIGKTGPNYKVDVYGDVNIDPGYSFRIGGVPISKSTVGLSNVDNTSDANKPISSATQVAIDNLQSQISAMRSSSILAHGNPTSAVTTGTIWSSAIGANTFSADGDVLKVRFYVSTNGTSAYGTVDIGLGSQIAQSVMQYTFSSGNRVAEVEIRRLTSSTARVTYYSIESGSDANIVGTYTDYGSVNWATSNNLTVSGAISSGSVIGLSMSAQFIPVGF